MNRLPYLFAAKAARVFVFGLVSIITPIYAALLGYSPLHVGIVLTAMIAGNIFSNLIITWYGDYFGRKRILLSFSLLLFLSGLILFSFDSFPIILAAAFIGNISATGTEAGPFQWIETGILPKLAGRITIPRAYGFYNFIGYGASSLGALAATIPSYFHNDLSVFRSLYLVYAFVGLLLFALYTRLDSSIEVDKSINDNGARKSRTSGLGLLSVKAKRDIGLLSAYYSMDAFGGGFVTQSILAYWFYFVYHLSLLSLGIVFLVTNIITALSIIGASLIAEKLGNLRTMVYSHIVSNVFLILVPLAGSLPFALLFLFLRQSVSQMDVPARQAFMAEIFDNQERVSANAITNTSRSVASLFGSPISGAALAAGLISLPLLVGGSTKVIYDVAIFAHYRKEVK